MFQHTITWKFTCTSYATMLQHRYIIPHHIHVPTSLSICTQHQYIVEYVCIIAQHFATSENMKVDVDIMCKHLAISAHNILTWINMCTPYSNYRQHMYITLSHRKHVTTLLLCHRTLHHLLQHVQTDVHDIVTENNRCALDANIVSDRFLTEHMYTHVCTSTKRRNMKQHVHIIF